MVWLRLFVLLLLSFISALAAVDKTTTEWERMHVIRRLHGEENSEVRKNIREVENRMYRYQTGLAPDPKFKVPYENHPYDPKQRRHAQESNEGADTNDPFRPMRIHFDTSALDSMEDSSNADKIRCK